MTKRDFWWFLGLVIGAWIGRWQGPLFVTVVAVSDLAARWIFGAAIDAWGNRRRGA